MISCPSPQLRFLAQNDITFRVWPWALIRFPQCFFECIFSPHISFGDEFFFMILFLGSYFGPGFSEKVWTIGRPGAGPQYEIDFCLWSLAFHRFEHVCFKKTKFFCLIFRSFTGPRLQQKSSDVRPSRRWQNKKSPITFRVRSLSLDRFCVAHSLCLVSSALKNPFFSASVRKIQTDAKQTMNRR